MKRNLLQRFVVLSCLVIGSLATTAYAMPGHEPSHAHGLSYEAGRVDGHAPIGVMGDHMHGAGEFMASYRYMTMSMAGNQIGQSVTSVSDVLSSFMVAPTAMTMQMHMLGAMFAPTNATTLMVMVPYLSMVMDHQHRNSTFFTRQSQGIGDVSVSALQKLYHGRSDSLHATVGIGLPTGSIDETDGQASRLPYPMQLGSGSYAFNLNLTYANQYQGGSFGAQAQSRIMLNDNKHDYRLGNSASASSWVAAKLSNEFSLSLRGTAKVWTDIQGADADLNPAMVPTAITNAGGSQATISVGANFLGGASGLLEGHRIAAEVSVPVYENYDRTQLGLDTVFTVGWQLSPTF